MESMPAPRAIAAAIVTAFPPPLPALKAPSNACSCSRQREGIAAAAIATVVAASSPSPLQDNFHPCKDAATALLLACVTSHGIGGIYIPAKSGATLC